MFKYLLPFIDDNTTEKDILRIIEDQSNKDKFNSDIENIVKTFKNGDFNNCSTKKDLTKYFEKNITNSSLRKVVLKILFDELESYFDVIILKSLTKEKLKDYLKNVFDCIIIHSITVEYSEEAFDEKYFLPAIRVINTANDMIILKRVIKDIFLNTFGKVCEFDEDILEFIWDLFNSKKKDVVISNIFSTSNNIEDIKNKIDMIYEIFKKFSDDNGD